MNVSPLRATFGERPSRCGTSGEAGRSGSRRENGERLAGDDLRNLVAGASQKPWTGRGKSGFPSTPPPLAPATSFPAPRLFLRAGRSGKPPNLSRVSPQDSLRRRPSATSRALSRFFIPPRLRRLVPRSVPCFSRPAPFRLGPRLSCLPFPPRSPFFPQASALPDGPCRGLSFCDRLCLSRGFPAPAPRRAACSSPHAPPILARCLSLVLRLSRRAPSPV